MKLSTVFNKERRERREKEYTAVVKGVKENPGKIKRVGNYISIAKGITATEEGIRFFLYAATPLGESIAWRGPIVMNTQDELKLASKELREGTFIKHP